MVAMDLSCSISATHTRQSDEDAASIRENYHRQEKKLQLEIANEHGRGDISSCLSLWSMSTACLAESSLDENIGKSLLFQRQNFGESSYTSRGIFQVKI